MNLRDYDQIPISARQVKTTRLKSKLYNLNFK